MEVGGTKEEWLFPDELKASDQLVVRITGTKTHTTKKGKEMVVLTMEGSLNGVPVKYCIAEWNVKSAEKLDTDKVMDYQVTGASNGKAFFAPVVGISAERVDP